MPFLLISFGGETRTIKCNADERCRRGLDRGEHLSAQSADANESRHLDQSPKGDSLWGFTYYLFTLHFSPKMPLGL